MINFDTYIVINILQRETPLGWLLHPSDMSSSISNIPYYQANLVSFLPQGFFHGTLVPFSGRWCLGAKIWVAGVLHATGVLMLLGPLSGES